MIQGSNVATQQVNLCQQLHMLGEKGSHDIRQTHLENKWVRQVTFHTCCSWCCSCSFWVWSSWREGPMRRDSTKTEAMVL